MINYSLYPHTSAVSVIFYCYMLQNKQSHRPLVMQCDVTRCVICISNNVEYLDKEEGHKNSILKKLHGEFK